MNMTVSSLAKMTFPKENASKMLFPCKTDAARSALITNNAPGNAKMAANSAEPTPKVRPMVLPKMNAASAPNPSMLLLETSWVSSTTSTNS